MKANRDRKDSTVETSCVLHKNVSGQCPKWLWCSESATGTNFWRTVKNTKL